MTRRTLAVALLALALATAAHASWYDDYDEGLAAVRKGNWNVVVQKMSAAIKGNAKEGDRVRTYGMITANYHPYYYRGVAYLNIGRYEEAVADLERTSGPGPENLGSIEVLMDRAKKQLATANTPAAEPAPAARPSPVVTQPAPTPAPATPAVPQMDPGLRQRAGAAIAAARQKLQAAQQRRATASPQYAQAMSTLTNAVTANTSARSNDDLNNVITLADGAGDLADLALAPSAAPAPVPSPALATTTPSPLVPVVPKPSAATGAVMDEHAEEVRRALEFYFAGEFEEATERFQALTRKMPTNGWIHAFLGASQYSRYAFEADESFRSAALDSFRRAKQWRAWKEGLPPKYFSKRIRQVFSDTKG
ncbi:MAG TPA: tetratricopeptide repeat protein [Thermoanaerobaculia bacterium]|nr:tetratricopeptide repeat protein [Thermoanaerobaculia bacterium]